MTVDFPLEKAEAVAADFVRDIEPYCERVTIVGSIRRRKPFVHDVDVLAESRLEADWTGLKAPVLMVRVVDLIKDGTLTKRVKSDGTTMVGRGVAFVEYEGLPIDLYYASPQTWGTLTLIRTGSTEHNIKLVSLAKGRGWKLHASGLGLFDAREGGKRLDDGTEEGIFRALGLEYVPPEARD